MSLHHHQVTLITKSNTRFDFDVPSDVANSFKSILNAKNPTARLIFNDHGIKHTFKSTNVSRLLIGNQLVYSAN